MTPETVGRETPMRSASSRVSSGPQTHRQKSIVKLDQVRPSACSASASSRERSAAAARKTFCTTSIAETSSALAGRARQDVDLLGQQLLGQGDH